MEEWEEILVPTHPIKDGRWVATIAEIRCNATGEIREHEMHEVLIDGDEQPNDYTWRDGNYSCDCNRRVFFNADWDENTDNCSEGLYSVRVRNKKSGRIWYSEFDLHSVETGKEVNET